MFLRAMPCIRLWGRNVGKTTGRYCVTLAGAAGISLLHFALAHADPKPQQVKLETRFVEVTDRWSGFYAGVDFGFASQNFNYSGPSIAGSNTSSVASGGLFAGYRKQFGKAVFGVEAGGDFLSRGGSTTVDDATFTPSVSWLAHLRGMAGLLVSPKDLIYVGAGPAWTNMRVTFVPTLVTGTDGTVGVNLTLGFEHEISDAVKMRVEYDQSRFEAAHPFPDLPTDLTVHEIKAGLLIVLTPTLANAR
jgi:opacity protein-like surface antigen